MRLRSFASAAAVLAASASAAVAQSRVIDEGTFVVLKGGAPTRTESFKIVRNEADLITATGHLTSGSQQITSSLSTDTLGTPVQYELHVKDKGAKVFDVKAVSRSGRLTSVTSTSGGDESMREYPLAGGQSKILETGLLHQLFFFALGKRPGTFQVIEPRAARAGTVTLTAKGLEPIEVAGRTLTATHFSLANGTARYEFWVDAQGRLLRVDAPEQGITATREELPR